jgi:Ca-activated chloride channel family protein
MLRPNPPVDIIGCIRMRTLWFSPLLLMAGVLALAQTAAELPSAPTPANAAPAQQQSAPTSKPPAPAPQVGSAPTIPDTTKPTASPGSETSKAADPAPADAAKPNAPAGNNTAAKDDSEAVTTITKLVQEVNVVFTVSDKHGHFVKDLKEADFKVLDDKKPPTQIVNFSSETNLPLRVGLLVDASNSVRDRFRFEQDSAIEFLNEIIRPRFDRAFVIGFDTTPEVTQDFTDNTEYLSKGVRALRPGGGTALYDAVYFACRDKLLKAPQTGPTRKAIILLSDGEDNQSRVTREEAIEMAQRAEVIVYTISTNVSGVKMRGDKVLERIAEATGGRAFFPFRIQDVSNAFSEIQDELRSQYVLAYKPADFIADGHFRSIDIIAADRKGLQVRARKGYFAPKP